MYCFVLEFRYCLRLVRTCRVYDRTTRMPRQIIIIYCWNHNNKYIHTEVDTSDLTSVASTLESLKWNLSPKSINANKQTNKKPNTKELQQLVCFVDDKHRQHNDLIRKNQNRFNMKTNEKQYTATHSTVMMRNRIQTITLNCSNQKQNKTRVAASFKRNKLTGTIVSVRPLTWLSRFNSSGKSTKKFVVWVFFFVWEMKCN